MKHYGISLLVFFINVCSAMDIAPSGQIIFLNGTTTSGKSSIALELKNRLERESLPVEILAIDDFMVPKVQWALAINRLNPLNLFVETVDIVTPLHMKEMGKQCNIELCQAAKNAYEKGKIVIIDAPVYRRDQVDFYKRNFSEFNVMWTLVYCPISTLVQRLEERNAKSGITGQRSFLQAVDQFSHLYSSCGKQVVEKSPEDSVYGALDKARCMHIAAQENIPDFLKSVQKALCPSSFDTIGERFSQRFLSFAKTIAINSVYLHDVVVNTELDESAQCAEIIFNKLSIV